MKALYVRFRPLSACGPVAVHDEHKRKPKRSACLSGRWCRRRGSRPASSSGEGEHGREGEEGVRERVSARRLTELAACISPGSALCLLPPRYTSARPSKRLWLLPLLPVGFALFPPKRREAATGQAAQAVYDCSY